jgi:signal transduction histidine kinase
MEITLWLGKTEIRTRNCDSAIIHLRHAYQISSKENFTLGQIEASLLISKCFEMVKIPDSALYYYRAHASIKDSILSLQKQRTIMNVTAQYENEKKEQEIRILQKEKDANALLLQLQDQQIEKQQLQDDKKSQQLALISQQNEINKLDASQKTLHLENEKKDNEKNQAKLTLLEQEAAYQKLLASKENQQKKVIYISIAAILSLLGYFIFRYIRKKRLINQQEVLNERLRISRELHDEVGATLSGIAMYSHLTKEQIKDGKTKEVEKSLNNIQQSAAEMILKLSDIVWLVNPEKDSMQKLIERLEQYAGEMTTIKGMEVNIHVSPRLANISLPVETRRNIYLFCKEAINNAVKYSNASIIELSMKESDNKKIEIAINDNGNGFDTSKLKNGNGLANMKQRAVDIAGDYLLQSSPGSGTKIGLTLKIT